MSNIDFNQVAKDAAQAGISVVTRQTPALVETATSIADGLVQDAIFLARKRENGELDENGVRRFLDNRKTVVRIQLLGVAGMQAALAEQVWNAITKVFRTAIEGAVGKVI